MELNYFDLIKKNDITHYKNFILVSNEPLQKQNIIKKIVNQFKSKNYEISYYDCFEENIDTVYKEVFNLSLFSIKKFIQLNFDNPLPKKIELDFFKKIVDYDDNIYLLVFNFNIKKQKIKSKWFEDFKQKSLYISVIKPNLNNVLDIINHEIKKNNLNLSEEAVKVLALKTEGNLIATKQIIKLLACQNNNFFNENNIIPFLYDYSSFNIFDLSDAIIYQNKVKAIKILNKIINENDKIFLIIWILKKELRILYQLKTSEIINYQKIFKTNNIWLSKQKFYISLVNRLNLKEILLGLEKCSTIDICIKSMKKCNIYIKLNEIIFDLL